jgi:hypothetical protein
MGTSDRSEPESAYRPGKPVLVWVMGTWQPGVALGLADNGYVLARYRRLDGELEERALPQSQVMETGRR